MGKTKQPKPKAKETSAPAGTIGLHFDDGRGQVSQDSGFRGLLEEQKARFRAKFGRDYTLHDPLFFDPDADEPVLIARDKLPAEVAAVFEQATIHSALIYAQAKVGYFLSPLNFDVAKEEEVSAWDEAVREFAYLKGII